LFLGNSQKGNSNFSKKRCFKCKKWQEEDSYPLNQCAGTDCRKYFHVGCIDNAKCDSCNKSSEQEKHGKI
jgi:hypothetical protein